MNTQKKFKILIAIVSLFSLILSACAARATQAPLATAVIAPEPVQEVEKQVIVPKHPLPTQAPAAAEAPRPMIPIQATPLPAGNTFQNYGINPFQDAIEDHLSTFALDVDTASYTVARRYVMDGNLPPSDAVRVEEFVN